MCLLFYALICPVLACLLLPASLLAGMRPSRHLASGSGAGTCCLFGYRRLLQVHANRLAFLAGWPALWFPPLSPSDLIISVSYCFYYIKHACVCFACNPISLSYWAHWHEMGNVAKGLSLCFREMSFALPCPWRRVGVWSAPLLEPEGPITVPLEYCLCLGDKAVERQEALMLSSCISRILVTQSIKKLFIY